MVAREAKTRLRAIKTCYEGELRRDPTLSGKVVVHWTITPQGDTRNVSIESDTTGAPAVGACLAELVAKWHFPAPHGHDVEVSFPFVFKSTK